MPATAAPTHQRALTITIALAVIGVFVTYIPITAVSVALTTIRDATGGSTADQQWISDAYIIPMAAAILSAGVFGDIHGRRRVFVLGMSLTVVGATIAALAGTLDGSSALHVLWGGQAISGLGAGLLLPTTLALIAHAVPDLHDRARFVALWATGLVLGLAIGPLITGVILESAGWGWIFVPVIVLALGTGVVAARWMPESKSPEGRHLDWTGQILATIAIATSIFGVIEGGESGWGATTTILGLAIGAVTFVAFVVAELRSSSPLLEVRLFRSPAFTAAGLGALVALFALVGTIFLLSLFFGAAQHLSPLDIAVRLLFLNGVTALVNPLAGRALRRVRPIALLAAGLALAAAGMLILCTMGDDPSLGATTWRLAILGVADAFILSAMAVAAIQAVPHRLAGMAAAANTAMRQYGAALGPAVLGVVFATRLGDGASMTSALHTGLIVCAVALAAAALACLTSLRRPATEA
jgi:MFS family permease